MTEINLMPPILVEKKKGQWRNVVIGVVVGAILLSFALWYAGIVIGVKKKEATLEKITTQIAELQPHLAEIRRLESDIFEMKKRVDVIVQLDKGRFVWAHILDEMTMCIPTGLWLGGFRNTAGTDLELEGSAFDNFSIANFMNNLINSTSFTNIGLQRIESTVINEYPIKTFSIQCSFRG
ncbi:MAG: PilN domain-containing protein [Nitrospirota bacterium]